MKNYSEIDAEELFNLIADTDIQLVDVRNQDEVDQGIISDAMHIQLAMLPLLYEKLMKSDTVIFYCHSGIRSAHAADFAVNKGVKNVYNLMGGIVGWNKAGYPLVSKK